jgi:hypothetical protein
MSRQRVRIGLRNKPSYCSSEGDENQGRDPFGAASDSRLMQGEREQQAENGPRRQHGRHQPSSINYLQPNLDFGTGTIGHFDYVQADRGKSSLNVIE